ncbi:MAG: hypothetical protein AUG51_13880 [Acidobacteria bacterium 13_1_20CM_3_53_8]|nr:MAG: hypothetical protein AUG51_13880 [Acidobacteria bacterium 13_1_20CM_3_53_8]
MLRLVSRSWSWLHKRGPFFVANLVIVAFMIWLLRLFFATTSDHPVIFGKYSLKYFIALFLLVVVVSIIFSIAIFGANKINRALFLTLLALFLIGEVSARLFLQPESDTEFFYPAPYLVFTSKPNGRRTPFQLDFGGEVGANWNNESETLNELGFRGTLPPQNKGQEYRIIMLGGSTVFSGFPLSHSIAGQLELLFHQDGHNNVRIYNWGVPAYVSGQELILLIHKVVDYQPDLVIVYDGNNDIYFPWIIDPRPGNPHKWIEHEAGLRELQDALAGRQKLSLLLINQSSLLRWAIMRAHVTRPAELGELINLNSLRNEVGYGTEIWKQRIASTYVGNHNKMCTVARGARFKLAMFLQPVLTFKRPLVGRETSIWNPEDAQQFTTDTYQYIRSEMNQQHPDQNEDCFSFDLSDIFLNYDSAVFTDWGHINTAGNGRVAQQIYERLRSVHLTDATSAVH